jgi:penicillin-binding protein 1C
MQEVSGVAGAAPVLHDVIEELRARYGTTWYPRPPEIVERTIHPVTGREIDPALNGVRPEPKAIQERFWTAHLPRREQASDYDAQGRVVLPREYARWLASGDNWLGDQAGAGEGVISANGPRAPKILMPLPGSTYYLDPDLPDQGSLLTLESDQTSAQHCTWSSTTLGISPDPRSGRPQAKLTPGRHEITATDPTTGKSSTTWLQVEQL